MTVATVGCLLFAYTLITQWDAVLDAAGHISLTLFFTLSAVQLLTFVARTFCWEACVRAAGATTPKAALHLASAASFFTIILGPAMLAPAARAATLRRGSGDINPPTRGQMVAADGVLFLIYGAVCTVFVLLGAGAAVPGWARLALVGGCVLVFALLYILRVRLRARVLRHAWVRPLLVLRDGPALLALVVAAAAGLIIQTWRWLAVLHAAGFPKLTPIQGLLTYALTTVAPTPVPIGPGLYPVSHSVKALVHTLGHAVTHPQLPALHPALSVAPKTLTHLAHSAPLADAVGAIIILTLSAVLAALIYALASVLIL